MVTDDEDDEKDLSDIDDPLESDMDADDEPEVVACPLCRKLIPENTDICPKCGNFIDWSSEPPRYRKVWIVAVVLVLIGMLGWMFSLWL